MVDDERDRLFHFIGFISRSCGFVASACGVVFIFLMTLFITVDVLGRYFIGKTTLVATEMSGYMLVGITFLGLAYTQRRGKNIKIPILISRLSQRKRQLVEIAALIVAVLFISWFTWCTWGSVIYNYVGEVTSMTPIHFPQWIPYLFIPVGLGMLAIELIIETIIAIRYTWVTKGHEIRQISN